MATDTGSHTHTHVRGGLVGRRGASVGVRVCWDGYGKNILHTCMRLVKKRINKNTFYKKTLITLNFIILDKEPEA